MATEQAQGAEQELEEKPTEEIEQPETAEEQPDEPEAVVALAREMGWKDDYEGEGRKTAAQFIRDGRDIQRTLASELKGIKTTLDQVTRTSAATAQQAVEAKERELLERFNSAVEEGDSKAALTASTELARLPRENQPTGPSPEAQSFTQRNSSWFQKDPLATTRAVQICNDMAAMGYDHATQLEAAEKQIQREFPQLFGKPNGHKPQASVAAPGSRSAAPSNRAKGFSDMPKENQDIARDMVARGVIPTTDAYVKNWLAITQKKD